MPACVAASTSTVAGLRSVAGTKLVATENLEPIVESALHAYVVAAAARGGVAPSAPLLHADVELHADALPPSKRVVDELNCVHDPRRELHEKFHELSEGYLEFSADSERHRAAEGFDCAGDAEVPAVVSDEIEGPNEEKSTTATVIAHTYPGLVTPDGGTDVSKDTATVAVTPTESAHIVQRNVGGATADDDYKEVFGRDTHEALRDADPTEFNNKVRVESQQVARSDISQTEFEGKTIGTGHNSPKQTVVQHVDPALKNQPEAGVDVPFSQEVLGTAGNTTKISHSFSFTGLNHVALCVENLERSLDFYCGLLGLKTSMDRPDLPYRGAWLLLGAEGIHIMEVPNPDPVNGRPAHGGFDRHACLNCKNVEGVRLALEKAGIAHQPSPVPSLFTRDPDGNGLEFIEVEA